MNQNLYTKINEMNQIFFKEVLRKIWTIGNILIVPIYLNNLKKI